MINNDDVWRDVFVTGLKNAHAVEHQALALMDRQIERARNFMEVAEKLKELGYEFDMPAVKAVSSVPEQKVLKQADEATKARERTGVAVHAGELGGGGGGGDLVSQWAVKESNLQP